MQRSTSFSWLLFLLIVAAGGAVAFGAYDRAAPVPGAVTLAVSIVIGTVVAVSVKVASAWERAVVLRLGRFRRLRGPGLFAIIPVVDTIPYWIDIRVMTSSFRAEHTLTRDTVPVDVAEKFGEAAKTYAHDPVALHLRAMNMLYEGLKQNATIVIVPSSALDTMQLGGLAGVTALSMGVPKPPASAESPPVQHHS
jgi:hypothetical protein